MATANDLIARALRLLNVLASGETASADEAADGLVTLNSLLNEYRGHGIGAPLTEVSVTSSYETDGNESLLCDTTAGALTVTLPDDPLDGMMVRLVDVANSFASANVTVARNGRQIAGSAANATLSSNGTNRAYFYRADTGNWALVSDLVLADTQPLPARFDSALAALLAVRLAPEYGRTVSVELADQAERGRLALAAAYDQSEREMAVDMALWRRRSGARYDVDAG